MMENSLFCLSAALACVFGLFAVFCRSDRMAFQLFCLKSVFLCFTLAAVGSYLSAIAFALSSSCLAFFVPSVFPSAVSRDSATPSFFRMGQRLTPFLLSVFALLLAYLNTRVFGTNLLLVFILLVAGLVGMLFHDALGRFFYGLESFLGAVVLVAGMHASPSFGVGASLALVSILGSLVFCLAYLFLCKKLLANFPEASIDNLRTLRG